MNNVVRRRLFLAALLGASATSASWRGLLFDRDAVSPSFNVVRNLRQISEITQENDIAPHLSASVAPFENAGLKTASNWSADWLFASENLAPFNLFPSNGFPAIPACPNGACPLTPASPPAAQKPTPPQGIVRSIVRIYNAYEETVPPADVSRAPARRRVVEKGSGAVVADSLGTRYVLTAAHIFRDGRGEIAAQTTDGRVLPASLALASEECDVALLRVDVPEDVPALTVSASWPRQGETVWRAGFGPDETLKESSGVVKGYVKTDRYNAYETLKIDGPARQGDSGGPVYNAAGEIVGVVWGTDGVDAYATYCGRVLKTLCNYSPTFAPNDETLDDAPFVSQPPTVPQFKPADAPPTADAPRVPVDALKNDAPNGCDAVPPAVQPLANATSKFRDYCDAVLTFALVFAFGYCGFFAGQRR